MTALAADRTTPKRIANRVNLAVAASAVIYAGALVCVNATGFAVKGATSTTLKVAGVAQQRVDNTGGADGAVRIEVERSGAHLMANSAAGDLVTLAALGTSVYIVDDQTVALTSGGGTRSVAGQVVDVDASGVWIEFH